MFDLCLFSHVIYNSVHKYIYIIIYSKNENIRSEWEAKFKSKEDIQESFNQKLGFRIYRDTKNTGKLVYLINYDISEM